jgi:anaphase-promoting complex subunit 1
VFREEMIAAAEPVEFIPSGRKIVEEHCGPLTKKNDIISSEFLLLDRMRNVNLSADDHFNESWNIRPVCRYRKTKDFNEELLFLTPHIVNSEEELYFAGHTAVWTDKVSETCYTSEDPIQFAFFCTRNFLDPDHKAHNAKPTKAAVNDDDDQYKGIAIIDSNCLKVFSKKGENLVTAVETPINKIWVTKHCVIFEKESSSAIVDGHRLPMPKIFSLTHALDDMYPVLLKSQSMINYITEEEIKVSLFFSLANTPFTLKFTLAFSLSLSFLDNICFR